MREIWIFDEDRQRKKDNEKEREEAQDKPELYDIGVLKSIAGDAFPV